MKIGIASNSISGGEEVMQEKMETYIQQVNIMNKKRLDMFNDPKYSPYTCVRELLVKEVGRRPDFLLLHNNKLINIEAKVVASETLWKQLDDNAMYCDYSFAMIMDKSNTPAWFKGLLVKKGYGLIMFNRNEEVVSEALEAHINQNINKELKQIIIKRIINHKA